MLEAKFELFCKYKFGVSFTERDYEDRQQRTNHKTMKGHSEGSQECPIVIEDEDPQNGSHLVRTKLQQSGRGALLDRGSILKGSSLPSILGQTD
jgi:hypothetical protein